MKVAEAMTANPLSIMEDDLVTKVRSIFRSSGYRSLPVIDGKGRLVGVITRRDMLSVTSTKSNVLARGLMSSLLVHITPEEDIFNAAKKMIKADVGRAMVVESSTNMKLVGVISTPNILKVILDKKMKPRKTSIKSIKTNKVITCDPKDKIAKVWVKMEDTSFSGMPVVKKKKVIGMITRGDILSSGTKTSASVEKVMKTPAITVDSNAKVEDALKLMIKHNIGRLPVVQKNRLVGIIDREDILEAWLY